jgi:hypothetical protein
VLPGAHHRSSGHPQRRPGGAATTARAVALAGTLGLALTGCSSSTHPAPAASTGASVASTAASTVNTSQASSSDVAAITSVYTRFIEPGTPIADKVGMVQDGPAFEAAMQALSSSDFAKQVSITVSKVTLDSPNKATVTYSILIQNSPVLPNTTGFAVREDGTWKVAGATLCGLLQVNNPKLPPACSAPAATSLPS